MLRAVLQNSTWEKVHHHNERMDEKGMRTLDVVGDAFANLTPLDAEGLASDRLRPSLRGKPQPR